MRLPVPFLPVAVVVRLERRPTNPLRWRIRLRTLLAVVLVAGLGLGWVARNVQRVTAQPALIARLRLTGVQVAEWKQNSWVLVSQILRRPSLLIAFPKRPDPLLHLTPTAVSIPRLSDQEVTKVVELLGDLPNLEWVTFPEGGLSPKGVEAIENGLPGIELLITSRSPGSSAAFRPK